MDTPDARPPDDMQALLAAQRAQVQRLDAMIAAPGCTRADLASWLGRDTYPTWMHAAYADLAGRLARLESGMQELEASLSLLHTKMETIIGQLAVFERQDPPSVG